MEQRHETPPTAVDVADRIRGCLLGGAIGDAMGRPFENQPGPVVYREHAPWFVSDDTQLTLATCEAIVQKGEVYEIYLLPEYQGVGLGTRLFLAARRELARFGFDSVVVWALADNEQACRFYRNAGGRKVARANERFGETSLTKVAFAWARSA